MTFRYGGRANLPDVGYGNKCFLFFSGYIYAKLNGLKIYRSSVDRTYRKVARIIKLKNCDDIWFEPGDFTYDRRTVLNPTMSKGGMLTYPGSTNIIMEGFFHDSRYIIENYDLIRNIIDIDYYRKPLLSGYGVSIGVNDVLCHLRLGDFVLGNMVVHPDYFLDIFGKNAYDKIYFMVSPLDDVNISVYFSYLSEYSDRIVMVDHKTELLDFYFPSLFSHVILSNSTFNWWSVFLNIGERDVRVHVPYDAGRIFYNRMYSSESHVVKYLRLC